MANKFRGTTWNNARFGPKIQIRRSIDLAELGDFGEITETPSDLPTAGAVHRKATGGSTSGTRGYTDLQGLFDTVVDNQDLGLVADATTAHRIWSLTGAITDIVTEAPTGIFSLSNTTALADWSASTLAYTLDNPNALESQNDEFGRKLAISGDYAIVGAFEGEGDVGGEYSGKAYIYNVSTGTLMHTIINPNPIEPSSFDYFGNSVAIDGDYAIIGAVGEGIQDDYTGKAYIYDVTTGALVHTLDSPGPIGTGVNDNFGWSVAISGDRAIVGAYGEGDIHSDPYLYSGKAYIFDVNTGGLLHTLDNPNAYGSSDGDQFGSAVAISGDRAIVGAYSEDDPAGTSSSKAYIFDVTTGALLYTLDNPNPYGTSMNDLFGSAVAISGDRAIVGAHGEDDADGIWSGKAYIYDVTTGDLVNTLDNPNSYGTSEWDGFGVAVAISDGRIIVGASKEDDAGGDQSGKVYIFTGESTEVSTSSVASWTRTWTMTSNFEAYVVEDVSERQNPDLSGYAFQGGVETWILAYPLQWSDDGYQLYIQGGGQQWIQHGVSTPWDPTSIIDPAATTSSTSWATDPQGLDRLIFRVVDGGDKVLSWRGGGTTQQVYMDTLSTNGDLRSKVNTTTNIWAAQDMIDIDGSAWKIDHMSPDGTKLYVATYGTSAEIDATTQKWTAGGGSNGTTIIEFTLSTAWDLTTISVTNSQSYSWYSYKMNGWRSVNFTPDGLTVYSMAKDSSVSVELMEHNLTTAWDISTASINSNTVKLFADYIDPTSATFTGDGTKIHFFDNKLVKTIDLEAEKDSGA